MIHKIILQDQTIEEFERKFSSKVNGKILTIKVELETGIDISIISSLGEEIISVKESGTYYPRNDITSRRYRDETLTGEVKEHDYFYVTDEILIELNSEGNMNGELALKELIILYDDLE
jgi:hypothetical protein